MKPSVALALASAVLAVTGCTAESSRSSSTATAVSRNAEATPSIGPVTDLDSFVQALEGAGYEVREGQPWENALFPVPGQEVFIGGARVIVFEYPTDGELSRWASGVTDHGWGIPAGPYGTHVEWVGPPHFFSAGTLLALYIGEWQRTREGERALEALELVLGPKFAGLRRPWRA